MLGHVGIAVLILVALPSSAVALFTISLCVVEYIFGPRVPIFGEDDETAATTAVDDSVSLVWEDRDNERPVGASFSLRKVRLSMPDGSAVLDEEELGGMDVRVDYVEADCAL